MAFQLGDLEVVIATSFSADLLLFLRFQSGSSLFVIIHNNLVGFKVQLEIKGSAELQMQ